MTPGIATNAGSIWATTATRDAGPAWATKTAKTIRRTISMRTATNTRGTRATRSTGTTSGAIWAVGATRTGVSTGVTRSSTTAGATKTNMTRTPRQCRPSGATGPIKVAIFTEAAMTSGASKIARAATTIETT